MRKVELRMKENLKYTVIKELVDNNGNKLRACANYPWGFLSPRKFFATAVYSPRLPIYR